MRPVRFVNIKAYLMSGTVSRLEAVLLDYPIDFLSDLNSALAAYNFREAFPLN